MNRQKFQNINPNKIDEIYRRYLSDDKVRNNLMKDIMKLNEDGCPMSSLFDSPETMILCGTVLTYMGINQWIFKMSSDTGKPTISETQKLR